MAAAPVFSRALLHPKHWPLWLAIGLNAFLAQMPFRVQLWLGLGAGKLLNRFASARRRIARINLQLCLPELTEAEREALLKRNMSAMGIGLMEQNMAWFMPRRRLDKLVTVSGLEHLQSLKNQGAILVIRHTSCVQLAVVAVTLFHPAAGMYRKHKNPVLDYVQRKGRERLNPDAFAFERKETRTMMRSLRQGVSVLYAPDQDYGMKHSVWATFFGVPAATVSATANFARMGKARVVMVDFVRKPGAGGYHLSFSAPLENFPSEDEVADAQRINDLIEAQVRATPEQYFWVHRRFKTRPEGEAPVY
ncbi:LpxL/LpxP family Kdo(2)-lipid IV(A) lauroyl/palmitoleoyl acyltransferase [Simiduia agarivorans]|uniref:Lipid A biosynthesis acyltransferase n=1 Tax=Simiduia agarivorans (strain DSM 21679 / JCM 13881 / BCRC 17597 / SA1) TaxID=1117647 RepID=K4KGY5_SIMAS|nr:LpxL/LpxP family Kdo(2)-lipid IV(A) lauroyl/palmitoleoyl acyltransferase [Simiduia agarivorans]AFU98256.1 lipid A biosynthesis lauroyl acyltransferase [Simiduia agarivorans SA1 = DSM 21679]